MGGLITLRYLAKESQSVAAAVVSAPLIEVAVRVPAHKMMIARVSARVAPRLRLSNEIDPAVLSRDPEVGIAYAKDPLVNRVVSSRWFTEATQAMAEIKLWAPQITAPLLVMHGTEDKLASVEATRQLFDHLGSKEKELGIYEGYYHELFNEPEKQQIYGRVSLWLDRHGVARVALIASVPGDEVSVAEAAAHHPTRIIGFFMVDPSASDAPDRVRRGITELGLRGVCLFPAMHHVPLADERVTRLVEIVAAQMGVAVFVHCGVLSVGVRAKLGLPSRFDQRLGNPLDVSRLALTFPSVPFIVPHFGAGMFREVLMAADASTNIYLDTSSSNSWIRYTPGLTLETVFKTVLAVAGPSRLLFGTDSSFFPRGWQTGVCATQRGVLAGAGVSASDAALIFGGNFDRLFPASR